MSKQQHADASLKMWDGPFFPESLESLIDELDKTGNYSGNVLHSMGQMVPGFFCRMATAETSDGYNWFWGLFFNGPKGRVMVLIPWSQDWGKAGGTKMDRSVAVYKQDCGEDVADHVVELLTQAVRSYAAV